MLRFRWRRFLGAAFPLPNGFGRRQDVGKPMNRSFFEFGEIKGRIVGRDLVVGQIDSDPIDMSDDQLQARPERPQSCQQPPLCDLLGCYHDAALALAKAIWRDLIHNRVARDGSDVG